MAWGLAGCSRKLPALLSLLDGRPSSNSGHPSSPTTSTLVCRVTVWLGVPPCERTTSNASARVMQARRPVKATVLLSAELSNSVTVITPIVAGATHLLSCLLLSRPASARTGCWSLLLLRIDTGTKRFHQIDHARRRSFPSGFDLFAGLLLLQQIDQSVFVAILELRRIEVTRFRLHDVGGQVEHLLRELSLGDVLEIWFLVANFIRVAECGAYETASLRFKGDYVLAPCQHDPAERNHVQLRNGVANNGKSLLTNCAIRGNVVGRVDIPLIDLIFWNELVNIDGARAFDLDGLYFLILNNHVLALCDLIAAHHVVPRDDLAGLRIDILLLQSGACFPVDPIETHFFAKRGGRIERNGARDQRKPKIALPVRTRRHWILLNNTRRANYTANFSKCLRPLSGVREPRARSSASRGPGDAPLQPMPGMRLARAPGCRTGRSW